MKPTKLYMSKLQGLIDRNLIPVETLALFVENPYNRVFDELQLVWKIIDLSSPQEQAALLWYLALTIQDDDVLARSSELWKNAQSLNHSTKAEIGCHVVSIYLQFHRAKEAREIISQIDDIGRLFVSLQKYYYETKDEKILDEIRQFIRRVEDTKQKLYTCFKLAQISSQQNDLAEARAMLQGMKNELLPDDLSWFLFYDIKTILKHGKIEEARVILKSISNDEARVASKTVIASHSQKPSDAIDLLYESPSSLKPLRGIVQACFLCSKLELARTYAQSISLPAPRCVVFSKISRYDGGSAKDLAQAQEAYHQMSDPTYLNEARLELAYALMHRGRYKDAFLLASKIINQRYRAKVYLSIYQTKQGNDILEFSEDEIQE